MPWFPSSADQNHVLLLFQLRPLDLLNRRSLHSSSIIMLPTILACKSQDTNKKLFKAVTVDLEETIDLRSQLIAENDLASDDSEMLSEELMSQVGRLMLDRLLLFPIPALAVLRISPPTPCRAFRQDVSD